MLHACVSCTVEIAVCSQLYSLQAVTHLKEIDDRHDADRQRRLEEAATAAKTKVENRTVVFQSMQQTSSVCDFQLQWLAGRRYLHDGCDYRSLHRNVFCHAEPIGYGDRVVNRRWGV